MSDPSIVYHTTTRYARSIAASTAAWLTDEMQCCLGPRSDQIPDLGFALATPTVAEAGWVTVATTGGVHNTSSK